MFEIVDFLFWHVFQFFAMRDTNRSCHACATLRWHNAVAGPLLVWGGGNCA